MNILKKVPRDRSKVFLNLRRIREEATTTDAFFFQYSRRGVFIWSMWRVSFDIKSFHKSHFWSSLLNLKLRIRQGLEKTEVFSIYSILLKKFFKLFQHGGVLHSNIYVVKTRIFRPACQVKLNQQTSIYFLCIHKYKIFFCKKSFSKDFNMGGAHRGQVSAIMSCNASELHHFEIFLKTFFTNMSYIYQ